MHTFAPKPKATQQTASAKSTIPNRGTLEQSPKLKSIFHLQRSIGNQAALRLLTAKAKEPEGAGTGTAPPPLGHEFSRIRIHPPATGAIREKPGVDLLRDQYEQEADRLAEQVMRMPASLLQLSGARGGARTGGQTEQQVSEPARLRITPLEPGDLGYAVAPPIVQEQAQTSRGVLETAPRFQGNQPTSTNWDFSRIPVYSSSAPAQRPPAQSRESSK
jgi:hypothetical protein